MSSVVESLGLRLHFRSSPKPKSESLVGLGVSRSVYDLGLVLVSSMECTKGEILVVQK